ncbi:MULTISPECIES: DUF6492 family protein [unclassified Rhizobium]|uniref:DUF6492 family protein n=1 Tax=unclassified Rhizobium TaxID=2613769 RepID=UPI00161F0A89|nr:MULTISPECIES: DUF6492 family protein [unclassified Rhizobium]MBB3320255.1 hypothetical protein [Rhizobium sp. BK181]MBB3543473.1 hypothetical protein [Rhizobium sp. BK399]MCS3742701.1 hypothetical protein [Rhizobium sp. BK661]MCS4096011.1 hypothetical protein [Rhizobium sp. BK176]
MKPSISLITPSHRGDRDRCRLLCDSIDRYVTGYDTHYIVVGDEDADAFAGFEGEKRHVVVSSSLLPPLWSLPKWRGRHYWWAPYMRLPVYGWHLQQLRKIAMTLAQRSDRVMCIDSDNCFCKPFDVGALAQQPKVAHFVASGDVNSSRPRHVRWWHNAHRLLGLTPPALPGDDFISQMVLWERRTVDIMTKRVEAASGLPWWQALARVRHFSEYLLYGVAVANDEELANRHMRVSQSPCLTYWEGPALDQAGLSALIRQMTPEQTTIAVQSHTRTPIDVIRQIALGTAA